MQWVSPKGHLEEGERSEEAAIREVDEEVGFRELLNVRYIGDQKYSYTEKGQENEKLVSWYVMEVEEDREPFLNGKEGFVVQNGFRMKQLK